MSHWSGPLHRVVVAGRSMCPTLEPGDRLVVVRGLRYRVGDIVAVSDPRQPHRVLVKRVGRRLDGGRSYVVVGDRPGSSTDSRVFGPVPRSRVRGRAVYRYFPPARAGPLRRRQSSGGGSGGGDAGGR